MVTWIALFRGINVGGNRLLPMASLRSGLESLKFTGVQTYIQSGNAVFQSASTSASSISKKIQDLVESEHGFRPHLILLTSEQLVKAVERNPFAQAASEPTTLHFFFLATPATGANLTQIDQLKAASESYLLTDTVFYLHTPEGLGRSKLAAAAEKHLGVVTTARNYRTVEKLLAMVQ